MSFEDALAVFETPAPASTATGRSGIEAALAVFEGPEEPKPSPDNQQDFSRLGDIYRGDPNATPNLRRGVQQFWNQTVGEAAANPATTAGTIGAAALGAPAVAAVAGLRAFGSMERGNPVGYDLHQGIWQREAALAESDGSTPDVDAQMREYITSAKKNLSDQGIAFQSEQVSPEEYQRRRGVTTIGGPSPTVDLRVPVEPPKNWKEQVADIGAGFGSFVLKLMVAKKMIGAPGAVGEAAAWESVNQIDNGPPGLGAAQGLIFHSIGKVGGRGIGSKVASGVLAGSAAAKMTELSGGSTIDQMVMFLVPVGLESYGAISGKLKTSLSEAKTPQEVAGAINEAKQAVINAELKEHGEKIAKMGQTSPEGAPSRKEFESLTGLERTSTPERLAWKQAAQQSEAQKLNQPAQKTTEQTVVNEQVGDVSDFQPPEKEQANAVQPTPPAELGTAQQGGEAQAPSGTGGPSPEPTAPEPGSAGRAKLRPGRKPTERQNRAQYLEALTGKPVPKTMTLAKINKQIAEKEQANAQQEVRQAPAPETVSEAVPAGPVGEGAKQPWEMTLRERMNKRGMPFDITESKRQRLVNSIRSQHIKDVEQAIENGETIPDNVFDEMKRWLNPEVAAKRVGAGPDLAAPARQGGAAPEGAKQPWEMTKETPNEQAEIKSPGLVQTLEDLPAGSLEIDFATRRSSPEHRAEIIDNIREYLRSEPESRKPEVITIVHRLLINHAAELRQSVEGQRFISEATQDWARIAKEIKVDDTTTIWALPDQIDGARRLAESMSKINPRKTVRTGMPSPPALNPKAMPKAAKTESQRIASVATASLKDARHERFDLDHIKIEPTQITATDGRRAHVLLGEFSEQPQGFYRVKGDSLLPGKQDPTPNWPEKISDSFPPKRTEGVVEVKIEDLYRKIIQARSMTPESDKAVGLYLNPDGRIGVLAIASDQGVAEIGLADGARLLTVVNADFLKDALEFHARNDALAVRFQYPLKEDEAIRMDATKSMSIVMPLGMKSGRGARLHPGEWKTGILSRKAELPDLAAKGEEKIGAPGGMAERLGGGQRPPVSGESVEAPSALVGPYLKPVEAPELLEIGQQITGNIGSAPQLRKSMGMFYAKEEGSIGLNPKVAEDPVQMADTLAHEIGHASDYNSRFVEKTMGRGNILGRVASLKKYLKNTLELGPDEGGPALTVQDRRDIQKQAKQIAGRGAKPSDISEIYHQLVADEIDARQLWARDDIHDELVNLSNWWKPYDRSNVTEGYVRYRESGREIFADAVSVLLRAPAELKARAPKFWEAMGNYMERKPEFRKALLDMAQILHGTPEELAARRSQRLMENIKRGDDQILAADAEANEYNKGFFRRFIQDIENLVFDKGGAAKKVAARAIEKAGTSDESNPIYIIDEFNHRGTPSWTLMKDVRDKVMDPMESAGVTDEELIEYVYANRILGDRSNKLNPNAWTPEVSQSQLDHLKNRMGPVKWKALADGVQRLHEEVMRPLLEDGVKDGTINQKLFTETIEPNIGRYATFLVAKYYDGHVSGAIKKQVGTFSDIANPFSATIMKAVAMRRLIEYNRTAKAVRDSLRAIGDTTEVKVPYKAREPKGRPKPGRAWLPVMENGKTHFYDVPKSVADSMLAHDTGRLGEIATTIHSPVYRVLQALYVKYSPSFIARNLPRDLRRTYVNLGAKYGVGAVELARGLKKAHASAKSYASGDYDPLVQQMMSERALNIPFVKAESDLSETNWVRGQMKKMSLRPGQQKVSKHQSIRAAKKLLDAIEYAGTYQEGLTKIAAYRILSERGVPTHERAYTIRKLVGTPDTGQRGLLNPITNTLWMYSKVRLNGMAADTGLAFNKETAGSYWARAMGTTVPAKLIGWGARLGLLGAAMKMMYDRIPDHYLSGSTVVPVGASGDGNKRKTVFLSIPEDETSSMFSQALWRLLNGSTGDTKRQFSELVRDLWQNLPSKNPAIGVAWKWGAFALGNNPTDDYFGGTIIPDTEYQAGGWPASQRMLTWTMNQTGAATIVGRTFWPTSQAQSIEKSQPTSFELVMGRVPGLNSILHTSDQGISEVEWAQIQNDEAEKARLRLQLPDVARRATRDRFILMQKNKKDLTPEDRRNLYKLTQWYNGPYLHLTAQIKVAEQKGDKALADAKRKDLERYTNMRLFGQ
jgi:hypothetical protein